jgi:integrase/recombinase XerD
MLQSASKILNKYRQRPAFKETGTIFPRITNQQVNRCLKIIQVVCDIPFTLTFHIARHTFAKTIALKNGIPITTVQVMMGHTKITTTMIYAEVDEEMVLEDTTGWQEKIDKKREIILAAGKIDTTRHAIHGLSV